MNMFLKIILAHALAICVDGLSSNYAILPQNVHQKDVSKSHNLNSVHFYVTSKPGFQPIYKQEPILKSISAIKPEIHPLSYGSIQYAPLDLKPEDQAIYEDNKINTKVTVPAGYNGNTYANTYLVREQIKKNNIEPLLEGSENINKQAQESVIYGHNIQVPQPRNPYPVYDVLNIRDNEYTTKDTKNQDSFIDPYLYNHKTEHDIEQTSMKSDYHHIKTNTSRPGQIYAVLAKQHNVKPDTYKSKKVLSEKESPHIQPQLLHARPYRLHLNVARAYNIAHAPSFVGRFINKFPSPSQTLLRKSDSTQLLELSEKRTKLISIQNKYINRRT